MEFVPQEVSKVDETFENYLDAVNEAIKELEADKAAEKEL